MEARDSFGYWVRCRRKALDLTQEELAQRVGCALITLRKIEADERRPSAPMAERLARALALPTAEWPRFVAVALGKQTIGSLELPVAVTARLPGNLPASVTALVGREAELAAITECLHGKDVRLLTLTGPVGVGKTRLAIEAGQRLAQAFRDGVYLVELASVRDPALMPSAIAKTLSLREGRNPAQLVAEYLAARERLLLLDNFEHLLPAAPFLSMLLAACPTLRLLVTSRARLHLYGEHEFVVAPLRLPDPNHLHMAADSPAVRLFCARAQAARADFHLTPSITPAVVEICRRLDGLPLAIELAAARIKLFSPQELQQRLERRLPLLTQRSVDLPARFCVLENAIAWSYGLLSPAQRTLLARLAVFAGGFNLSAAEAICASPLLAQAPSPAYSANLTLPEVADGVTALLDQSLLIRQVAESAFNFVDASMTGNQTPGEIAANQGFAKTATMRRVAAGKPCPRCPMQALYEITASESRFSMLETIREFALERLAATGEIAATRQRHAEYFATWAEQAAVQLYGPEQVFWLACLECNLDNLRSALTWLHTTHQIALAAHMACALAVFWQRHGHYSEGRRWLQKVLELVDTTPIPAPLRARTLQTMAMLTYRQGDWQTSQQWLMESLAFYQSHADQLGTARVLFDLGWIAIDQANWGEAMRLNEESLTLARTVGDALSIYRALTNLGWTQLCVGEREAAALRFDEAYVLARQSGHTKGVAVSLANLGWIALYRKEAARTVALAKESLRLCCQLGEREIMAECLELLAVAAIDTGDTWRSAVLSGAAEALREALHILRPTTHHAAVAHTAAVAAMRQQLTAEEYAAAWCMGRSLDVVTLIGFALGCRSVAAYPYVTLPLTYNR